MKDTWKRAQKILDHPPKDPKGIYHQQARSRIKQQDRRNFRKGVYDDN